MMKKTSDPAFTRFEVTVTLAVVIALGFVAQPVLYAATHNAACIKDLSSARNIGMALKTYANEHDGKFPDGKTAAEVFSKLLPQELGSSAYISDKRQFFVRGSKYTPPTDEPNNSNQKKLAEGENHWGYMARLDDSGSGRWPLLFDGPASPDGMYSANHREKGGVREGKLAIVVRLDGSANAEQLKGLYVSTDGQENVLKPTAEWAIGGKLLMPW